MMSEASLSDAAAAAISISSTALSVAVTGAGSPPWAGDESFYDLTIHLERISGYPPWLTLRVFSRAGRDQHGAQPGGRILVLVELALADVLHDPLGHQVPDRVAGPDPGPALGRGDGQGGDLDQADVVVGQTGQGQPVPGPGAADEVGQLEQLVGVPPGDHLGQGVGPGDEEELRVGAALGPQVAQRVDGVGLARPVDFNPAHREPRVRRGGNDRHQVAVLARRHGPAGLLVRHSGRYEDDLIEREHVRGLAGRDEVAVVDRVERAAHDADPRARLVPADGAATHADLPLTRPNRS